MNRLLSRHLVPDLPESELDEKFVRGEFFPLGPHALDLADPRPRAGRTSDQQDQLVRVPRAHPDRN